MKNRLKVILLLALCLWPKFLPAVSSNRDVKVLLMKDGLLSDYVNCIDQDPYNRIWIGTEFGLNRYDGVQMTSFTFDPLNSYSIGNNFIHDIYVDKSMDAIWVATDAGINRYDYSTGRFSKYLHRSVNNNPSYNDIIKIIPKDSQTLWLASYRGGVHLFDKKTGRITWIKAVFDCSTHTDGAVKVQSIFQDNEKNLWIGTRRNGIYKYSPAKKTIRGYLISDAGLLTIESFFQDSRKGLWVGSGKGIWRYDISSDSFISDTRFDFLTSRTIKFIKPANNHTEVNIGTDNGLFVLRMSAFTNLKSPIHYQFFAEDSEAKGLSASYINDVFEDKSKNLWVATASGGINLLLNKPSKFELIYETNKRSTLERKFLPITEDTKGRIWFGSDIDQIYISDTLQTHFSKTTLNKDLRKFGISEIQTMFCSKSNVLWLGTPNNGLVSYNLTTNQIYVYHSQNSNLPDNDVRIIKEDSRGNIWVGTNKGGLCSFYQKSQSFEIYNANTKDKSFNGIRQLVEDNEGNWWIGTEESGLRLFNPMSGKILSFESGKQGNYYIPDNYISTLFLDSRNKVWVGTRNGGLSYYNRNLNQFKSISPRTGIPQSISHIQGDSKGNLWITSINSVYCFNPDANTVVSYSQNDGVNGGLFLINSGVETTKGTIFFASTKGIICFNPTNFYSSSETAFPPLITSIQISNHSKDENENLWIRNLEKNTRLSLLYNQSSFTVYFVSPNYEHANETKYAYYLEGEETSWNYMGNNNFASYRNLAPGTYVFKVKASSANNRWCKTVAKLIITIHPPFWATWWMKFIYFLFFIAFLWGLWKYALARIKRINDQRLEVIERHKNDEINNAKLQFFTNISHEFRTPITLILNPLAKIIEKENDPEKKYLLEVMRKNSNRLLRLVNEVLDFRKLDKETIQMHFEKTEVIQFIKDLFESFAVYSKEKKMDMTFNHSEVELSVWIDREVVEKTVLNLLSNALKFSFEGSEVILSVENDKANQSLIIEVKDFGIGLSRENKAKVFEQFFQVKSDHQYTEPGSGIGLYLVKSLVELHNGSISVESEENKGSKFTVVLPYAPEEIEHDVKIPVINDTEYNWDAEIEMIHENSDGTPVVSETKTYPKTKYTLLIVEDDSDVRGFLVNEFKNEFHILEAENGAVALAMSKEKPLDIVLSDIMMPKMNGIEFCEAFKKDITTCHIPFILLTAKSSIENKIEGIEFGADDYVVKPFSVKYLRTKMYSLIRKREEMSKAFGKNFSINSPVVETKSIDDILITKAIEYIRLNITNADLNGEMLADKLNISRVHLYRKLKALVDCSSSEFIRRVRLKHAITLLDANNLSISEIAYDCGFSSPAYFSTSFSGFYGMSPKEYLHQKQNNPNGRISI